MFKNPDLADALAQTTFADWIAKYRAHIATCPVCERRGDKQIDLCHEAVTLLLRAASKPVTEGTNS